MGQTSRQKGKKPYVYSKEALEKRVLKKSRVADDVQQEVISKLKSGVKADSKMKISEKEMKSSTRMPARNPGRMRGKKSKVQKLAESLPIPKELPDLPDYLRTFAFRYATEPRRHMDWAVIFHVSIYTIRRWLLKPNVMQYILKIKSDRQKLMLERLEDLEKRAYEKLNEILSLPVTEDTAEVIRKTILDVISVRKGEPVRGAPAISVNQSQNQAALSETEVSMSIEDLKGQIKELEAVDSMIEGKNKED